MKILSLNQYLNLVLTIDEPALNLLFTQLFHQVKYARNDMIYQRGKMPQHLCYLYKGNAMALSQSVPVRQVLRIWQPGQFICPVGFFNHAPASHSIIALDDCTVDVLDYRQLYRFLNEFPIGYKILNAMMKEEIQLLKLNIKSLSQNKTFQNHEALLEALAITYNE